jgi:ribosomal protein S21
MKYQNQNNYKIIQGASVSVRNDDVNFALKKLKKILDDDNRQKDLAKHEFFEKNSVKRKRSKAQAKKRQQRAYQEELVTGVYKKPKGVKWMKSRRKRRKVLDQSNAFVSYQRQKNKG